MSTIDRLLGYLTLGNDVNKAQPDKLQDAEGIVSPAIPVLTVDTPDSELISQKTRWLQKWQGASDKLSKKQKDNENYWKGKHNLDFLSDVDATDSQHREIVTGKQVRCLVYQQ